MNVKKLISIARYIPGVSFPDVITFFADLIRDEIIKKAKDQNLIHPENKVVALCGVNTMGDLIIMPVEIEHKKGEKPKIVQEFTPSNIHKTIRETDIDKAIDLFTDKANEASFFEIMEKAKKPQS